MNSIQTQLLYCLAAYRTGKDTAEYVGDLSGEDWRKLYDLAAIHKLIPVVSETLWRNPEFCDNNPELKTQWKRDTLVITTGQAVRSHRIIEICNAMQKENISYALMKGLICRELYSRPDLRISGDEDLLIKEEDRERCSALFEKLGLYFSMENGGVTHWSDKKTGLHIELHTAVFTRNTDEDRFMNDIFVKQLGHVQSVKLTNGEVMSFSPNYHLLFLIYHALKHFTIAGVGIRTLCDIISFAEKYHSEIDIGTIEKILEKINAKVFFEQIIDIGQKYLDCDLTVYGWKYSVFPDSEEMLIDCIEGGIYGKSTASRTHSATLVSHAMEDGSTEINIGKTLFPPKRDMQIRYPILKKYPVVLPVCWIHRIGKYAQEQLEKQRDNSLPESIAISRQRTEMLAKYKIIKK